VIEADMSRKALLEEKSVRQSVRQKGFAPSRATVCWWEKDLHCNGKQVHFF